MGRPSGNPALVAAWHVERALAVAFLSSYFERCNGNLLEVAEKTGIDRRSLYRWLAEDSKLRAALKEARRKKN